MLMKRGSFFEIFVLKSGSGARQVTPFHIVECPFKILIESVEFPESGQMFIIKSICELTAPLWALLKQQNDSQT